MREPLLVVRSLRKEFGDFVAVDDLSFTLDGGQSLAIVGESGSGKSTSARMIVGLEAPTSGSIVFDGQDRSRAVSKTSVRRRRAAEIQIVFQDPYASMDPRQTVGDGLRELLALHGVRGSQQLARMNELLAMVGLGERHARSQPGAMSGGQRQRVAIARALAAEPRVLVLDEAVAALDVSIQAQIVNLLAEIRESTGLAYIFISHDLAVVRQVTDEAIVMCRGIVVERGATAAVLDDPQHEYTRTLRASVPGPGWTPAEWTTRGGPGSTRAASVTTTAT